MSQKEEFRSRHIPQNADLHTKRPPLLHLDPLQSSNLKELLPGHTTRFPVFIYQEHQDLAKLCDVILVCIGSPVRFTAFAANIQLDGRDCAVVRLELVSSINRPGNADLDVNGVVTRVVTLNTSLEVRMSLLMRASEDTYERSLVSACQIISHTGRMLCTFTTVMCRYCIYDKVCGCIDHNSTYVYNTVLG